MKKILYILAVMSSLALSSCENMFNKMITYNGKEEPAVLCLNAEVVSGEPVRVYLTHSWFFLDTDRYVGNPNNGIQRRGIVSDATVEMQVNGGDWQALTFVQVADTTVDTHKREGKSYYTTAYLFQAGDRVTIRARHPDYKEVTATETVPAKPQFTLVQSEVRDRVVMLTLSLEALPVTDGQVIYFEVTAYGTHVDTTGNVTNSNYNASTYDYDTVVYRTSIFSRMLYCEDFMFSEFNLPRTSHNYYAQNGSLYTSADHFREPKQLTLLLDLVKWSYTDRMYEKEMLGSAVANDYSNIPQSQYNHFDSIVVSVRMSNESYYMYRSTVAGSSISSSAPEISWFPDGNSGNEFGDIFEEIADIFDELGNQEGTQIFSNVEGGFGHFCFLNSDWQTQPVDIQVDIETNYYYD